jgi:inhibitor of KinA
MNSYPHIRPIADTGVLIEFGDGIDDAVHAQVLAMDQSVQSAAIKGVTEMIPAYAALYVGYDCLQISFAELSSRLNSLLDQKQQTQVQGKHWDIPVCFDPEFAPDMDEYSDKTGLTSDAVVEALTSAIFKIYMYGFAPGYAYMGGVPAALQIPRKSAPVMGVPPKAMMVAGEQCLITTVTMPSGWWVLGKSGVNPLQANSDRAFMFDVGDTVGFEPLTKTDFDKYGQG